jgi:hypothetical protein
MQIAVNVSNVEMCPHCLSSDLLFVDSQYGSCLNCYAHLNSWNMVHYFEDGTSCTKQDIDDECKTQHGNWFYNDDGDQWEEYEDIE